jgi:DNA-binding beta-propeller fold protein YncE
MRDPEPKTDAGVDRLVISAKTDNVMQFIDAVTLKVQATIAMPASTHELALSADGRRVFGSVYGGGIFGKNSDSDHRVVEVDLIAQQIHRIHVVRGRGDHKAPHGLQFAVDGLLWITSELAAHVMALEPNSGDLVAEIDVGAKPHWLAISHRHNRLFTGNKTADFVTVVDLETQIVVGRVPIPSLCEGVAVSPDGSIGFACSHTQPEFYLFDTETLAVSAPIRFEGSLGEARQLRRIAVSPDQQWITVTSHVDGHLAIFEFATRKQVSSLATSKAPMGMGFAADGQHMYVCCHDAAELLEIHIANGVITRRAATARGCEFVLPYRLPASPHQRV